MTNLLSPPTPRPASGPRRLGFAWRCLGTVLLATAPLTLTGCINAVAMTYKVLKGDPVTPAAYKVRNGVELTDGKQIVAVVVDAPYSALNIHDSLVVDLQDEMLRRFRLEGIATADVDEVSRQLEDRGGQFDPTAIAQNMDVDLIVHVQVERFSDTEPGGGNFYRGRAESMVRAFEVRGERGSSDRHVVETFQQDVLTLHPETYPLPADQTPRRVFMQKFVNRMGGDIAQQFYDVTTSQLF
ncbi:MAG: hypothetical protein R3B90_13990 [Planctomycetaceae bacterium]